MEKRLKRSKGNKLSVSRGTSGMVSTRSQGKMTTINPSLLREATKFNKVAEFNSPNRLEEGEQKQQLDFPMRKEMLKKQFNELRRLYKIRILLTVFFVIGGFLVTIGGVFLVVDKASDYQKFWNECQASTWSPCSENGTTRRLVCDADNPIEERECDCPETLCTDTHEHPRNIPEMSIDALIMNNNTLTFPCPKSDVDGCGDKFFRLIASRQM